MDYFIEILLRDGKHASLLVIVGTTLFGIFYAGLISYPILRSFRERGQMRIVCVLLGASFSSDLVSNLLSAFLAPRASDSDLAYATTTWFFGVLLFFVVGNGVAVFGILSRRRWGAIVYLILVLLSALAPPPDDAHAITAVTTASNLETIIDGAIVGLLLLARREEVAPSVRERLPSIF